MASEKLSVLGKEYEIFKVSGIAIKVNESQSTNLNVDTSYLTGAPSIHGSSSTRFSTKILLRYKNSNRETVLDLYGQYPVMDGQRITVNFLDGVPYYLENESTAQGMRVSEGEEYLNKAIPGIPLFSFIWPFPALAFIISVIFVIATMFLVIMPLDFLAPDALKEWGVNFLLSRGIIDNKYQAETIIFGPLFSLGAALAYIWYARLAFRRKAARQKLWGAMVDVRNS